MKIKILCKLNLHKWEYGLAPHRRRCVRCDRRESARYDHSVKISPKWEKS